MPKKPIRSILLFDKIAHVVLTQGLVAVIDIDDLPLVEGYNWHATGKNRHRYAARWDKIGGKPALIVMHRHILKAPEGIDVDHVNGNGLDNRRCNIRLATRSQNMHNKRMQRNNTSGFKGVHWNKNVKKWQANIKLSDKRKFLGSFDNVMDAAKAYQDAAQKLHGEFSRLE